MSAAAEVLPRRLSSEDYIGPKVDRKLTRNEVLYPHYLNESISTKDSIHPEKVEKVAANVLAAMQSPVRLVGEYREEIRTHIEHRLHNMFQQLVVCYATQLHFEHDEKVTHQGQSATALKVKANGKTYKICTRNAAHSSTLPCLMAYDGAEWATKGKKAQKFRYLLDSDYHRHENSTKELPKAVNDADREMDEKRLESTLRDDALKLLNRAAKGKNDPIEGLNLFIDMAVGTIRKVKPKVTDRAVLKVLAYFREDLLDFKAELEANPALFDQMLDLKGSQSRKLRSMAYKLRYRAIQGNHSSQAQLMERVNKVRGKVLGAISNGRKPNYFDHVFRRTLVSQMATTADKGRVKKLLNFTEEPSPARRTGDKTKYGKTQIAVEGQLPRIQKLAHRLKREMYSMRVEEIGRRGKVLRLLRNQRGWSQAKTGSKISALRNGLPSSQSTVSRIETGDRVMGIRYAGSLATILKVDSVLFVPQGFAA